MPRQKKKKYAAGINDIRAAREGIVKRVCKLPNVRGTMIGLRITDGAVTDEMCLTVLVSIKQPPEALKKNWKIPRSLKIGSSRIPIDVLEMGPMGPQSNIFTPKGPLPILVHGTGTVGAYCRSRNGLFGLTCAHVLGNFNVAPGQAYPVQGWSQSVRRWVPIGRTVLSVYAPGSGTHGDFGFVDTGLLTLEYPELVEQARSATVIESMPADGALCGRVVRAHGSVHDDILQGQVIGVEKQLGDLLADVVIRVASPGTFEGDSGMLWKDENGAAIALHAYGEIVGQGGSPLTAAMSAARASMKLGVNLLSLPN